MTGKELKEVLVNKKIVLSGLARHLDMSPQALNSKFLAQKLSADFVEKVYSYIDKVIKEMSTEPLQKIHRADTQKTDLGHTREGKGNSSLLPLSMTGRPNCIVVPLKAQAGFAMDYERVIKSDEVEKIYWPLIRGQCFMFEVEGLSMMPDFPPGSWAVATELEDPTWLKKGAVYVFQNTEGIIIKEFDKIVDGKCYLKSINPDPEYKASPFPVNQLKKAYYVDGQYNPRNRQVLGRDRQIFAANKLDGDNEYEERLQRIEAEFREFKALFYNEEDYKKAISFLKKPLSETSICMTDIQGRTNFINGQFTKQTGYNEKDVMGKKPGHVLQRGNSDQPAIDQIRKALRSRQYFEGEVVNYNKAGKEIICKLIIAPAKGKGGKIDRFISLAVFSKSNVLKYN